MKATKKLKTRALAHEAIDRIAEFYEIEKRAKLKNLSFDEIKLLRQTESKPLLNNFKTWLDEKINQVPDSHAIAGAIKYCLKFWCNLTTYIEDGRLDIDNNLSERAIKAFATGRKNGLLVIHRMVRVRQPQFIA